MTNSPGIYSETRFQYLLVPISRAVAVYVQLQSTVLRSNGFLGDETFEISRMKSYKFRSTNLWNDRSSSFYVSSNTHKSNWERKERFQRLCKQRLLCRTKWNLRKYVSRKKDYPSMLFAPRPLTLLSNLAQKRWWSAIFKHFSWWTETTLNFDFTNKVWSNEFVKQVFDKCSSNLLH